MPFARVIRFLKHLVNRHDFGPDTGVPGSASHQCNAGLAGEWRFAMDLVEIGVTPGAVSLWPVRVSFLQERLDSFGGGLGGTGGCALGGRGS